MPESVAQKLAEQWRSARHRVGLLLRRRKAGMHLLRALRIAAAPREFVLRKRIARERLRGRRPQLAVDPRLGYRWIAPGELPGLERAVRWAREIEALRTPLLPAILATRAGKHRILFDILSDAEIARRPEMVDFALGDELLDAAIDYLGTVPVLWRIGVGLSIPDPRFQVPLHSQLLHLDGEDFAQLKLMVNASHVTREDGPFSLLPADATERVLRGARLDVLRRVEAQNEGGVTTTPRFSDAEAFRHADPSELVRLEGPPGSALLVDTSRCLHFGSRVAPGRQRLVFAVAFQRYHLVNTSPFNSFESSRPRVDALRQLVLERPRRCDLGTFYPEPDLAHPAPPYARAVRSTSDLVRV